tara:strand:+ start:2593 stop:2943 length:351 start_codon:yes stop_codon:yes gene_type:complete
VVRRPLLRSRLTRHENVGDADAGAAENDIHRRLAAVRTRVDRVAHETGEQADDAPAACGRVSGHGASTETLDAFETDHAAACETRALAASSCGDVPVLPGDVPANAKTRWCGRDAR